MDTKSKDGWKVKVRVDGPNITDQTLENLWAATRDRDGDPYGVGSYFVDYTPASGDLIVEEFSKLEEFDAAVNECLDKILYSIGVSGMGGQIVSMEARCVDFEESTAKLRAIVDELMGNSEVAESLKVSRQRVSELARTNTDFPQPVAKLASGPVYAAADVKQFQSKWARKRTGRPPKTKREGADTDGAASEDGGDAAG